MRKKLKVNMKTKLKSIISKAIGDTCDCGRKADSGVISICSKCLSKMPSIFYPPEGHGEYHLTPNNRRKS